MAKITIVNEEGQNLNRYLITPTDGGTPFTADLARAANITKQGTPFAAQTMEHYVQSEDLLEHTENSVVHVSEQEREKWNDGLTATALHTRTGTVNNLAIPTGAKNLTFLATAGVGDNEKWTVNGQPVTAMLRTGRTPLPATLFAPGSWVTGVRLSDDGKKLTFPGTPPIAYDAESIQSALTLSTSAPSYYIGAGKIWGVY
ncbi:hypothetical protein [Clostridium merdae]|uniref:hypothetical protein n=1 Tax=Clostridium merdae TaxID=1958780 RepID=UPI000A26FC58|nr:hypothetical protein [Clostridium merdae]